MKIVGTCLVLMALFGLGWLLSDRTEHSGPTGSGQDRFTQACGSCHQLPEPSDLPRSVWDTIVLPRMRQFIAATGADIPPRDWEAITEYILSRAPKSFRVEEVKASESPLFTAEFPDMRLRPPSGSYVSILP
ncbi:MAG: cytochrome c, partial [Lewinella sp.]